jgi:hypothetical protein
VKPFVANTKELKPKTVKIAKKVAHPLKAKENSL